MRRDSRMFSHTRLAMLLLALGTPAFAQHVSGPQGAGASGGHAGGFHGGFTSSPPVTHSFSNPGFRGAPPPSGAFHGAPVGGVRPGPAQGAQSPGYGYSRPPYGPGMVRFAPRIGSQLPYAGAASSHRFPVNPVQERQGRYFPPRRSYPQNYLPGYPFGYPGTYPGVVGWNVLDLDALNWNGADWNPNTEDDSAATLADNAQQQQGAPNPAYEQQMNAYSYPQPGSQQQPLPEPAEEQPAPSATSQPAPLGPTAATASPAPLRPEDPITIVFKDGRPPLQVSNYALTRNAILLTSPRLHEISLTEVDLPATERVNHDAGLEFALPQAQ